jgi:hypothetical protein
VLRLAKASQAHVYALAVNGQRLGEVATSVVGTDTLSIPLSVAAGGKARMLYEVEVHP